MGTAVSLIPDWPPAHDIFFNNAARAYKAWMQLDVSLGPNQICGLLANHEGECAFRYAERGDKDQAAGVADWHKSRRDIIMKETGTDVWNPATTLEDQIKAAHWELTTLYSSTWALIKAAHSASEVAQTICLKWEGAGAAMADLRRGMMAERWRIYFIENPV